MPARKHRPDKHGVGRITDQERAFLGYWFLNEDADPRDQTVTVGADDVVYHIRGFDSDKGRLVRGLVTKGYCEPTAFRGFYRLTQKGLDILKEPIPDLERWYPNAIRTDWL